MFKSAAGKVMWVGRATVFIVGLAVILALVLGVATTAIGATGGNFILGKGNAATAITKLAGAAGVNGPMLQLINNNADPNDTALDLRVQAGEAPMRVNSNTKVANLTADKLDGKDASAFAAAYERTVVVSPTGTDAENGQALLNALSGITDASATKRYLLHVEPGTYDLGNGALAMKEHVDIQGSGELGTIVTSGVAGDGTCPVGTVFGASNAELRSLTVRNTGTGPSTSTCTPAILNNGANPRLTDITAEATGAGGSSNYGVRNRFSSPDMTDVTARASGGASNFGVGSTGSNPTIKQSTLSGNTYALVQSDSTGKVALTQLDGPVFRSGGTLQCFDNYNANMAAVTCP